MTKCVVIEKNGDIKETVVRDFDLNLLYKKCLLQSNKNFTCVHTWELKKNSEYISLYAKNTGRAGSENKYDLPPPLDKVDVLFFGKMLLVKHSEEELENENVLDMKESDWTTLYEKLFGGFESLGEEDEYSEEEIIPKELRTKHGYMKDGFVVDSDESDSDLESFHESELSNDEENMNDQHEKSDDEEVLGETNYKSDTEEEYYDSDDSSNDDGDFGSELSEESYLSD